MVGGLAPAVGGVEGSATVTFGTLNASDVTTGGSATGASVGRYVDNGGLATGYTRILVVGDGCLG